ncbi:unnamed protein product [Ilex paraguariensis]|uniref:Uncharacterized protein n=1 Tax=Ilex paraguariensis TaxID=185542 RepID=A0ABC8REY1_9AQUA
MSKAIERFSKALNLERSAMEFYEIFSFVGILRESIKLLPKNGKLMVFITTLALLLYTLFFFLNISSIKPLIFDLVEITTRGGGANPVTMMAHIKEDLGILLVVESIFLFASLVLSLFATTAVIFISALSYCNKTLSIKDLVLKVSKSWTRPFITGLYTILLGMGYLSVLMCTMFMISMFSNNPIASKAIVIVFGILGSILSLPLTTIIILALVISVIEENCYGIEALGKAGKLVNGQRVQCFILNFLFLAFSWILYLCLSMGENEQLLSTQMILVGLFRMHSLHLVYMLEFIAFTVLYFHCKKSHGEEIEMQWCTEYSKISAVPLDNDTP